MSGMLKNRNLATLLIGGISLLGLSFLAYYYFARPTKTIVDEAKLRSALKAKEEVAVEDVEDESEEEEEDEDEEEDEEEEEEEEEEEPEQLPTATPAKSEPKSESTVNNTPTKDTTKTVEVATPIDPAKEQYDAAVRLSTKYINGQLYEKAVEKLSEAINLSFQVPSSVKDIQTLYNNRSAMYEKLKQYEASLRDIEMILTTEPKHLKARIRRGRVYEALGDSLKAMEDYVFAILIERFSGMQPSISDAKMNELCRNITLEQLPQLIKEMRNSPERKLPSKSFCRNFLEAFPNTHVWKADYFGNKSISREDLVENYSVAKNAYTDSASAELYSAVLEAGLALVKYDFAHDTYSVAFHKLHDIPSPPTDSTGISAQLLSDYYEFLGSECHLKCQVDAANTHFSKAVELCATNLSAQLKYASLLNELGESSKAFNLYNSLLTSLYPESDNVDVKTARCWILIHRASFYLLRDEKGSFHPQAIPLAVEDFSAAVKLTDAHVNESIEAKSGQFVALLRSVYLRTQSKQQIAPVSSEEEMREDLEKNKADIEQAKKLFPNHDQILFLEAESYSAEGDLTGAMRILEQSIENHKNSPSFDPDDITPLVIKASILTNQAFGIMQAPSSEEDYVRMQELFREAQAVYEEALAKDSTAIEIMGQYAQLKTVIFMDIGGAVNLLRKAKKHVRSRDELLEINQMLLSNEAQYKAMCTLAPQIPQTAVTDE